MLLPGSISGASMSPRSSQHEGTCVVQGVQGLGINGWSALHTAKLKNNSHEA